MGINFRLMAIVAEQDQVLAEMADRTRQIQEATAQRREELNQLRAAREQRERDAQKAASSANENKPHQKDEKDSDSGGGDSSTTQPSN